MRFIHQYRYALLFLLLLVICSILVVREYVSDDEAHVKLREDFILLVTRNQPAAAQRLYQLLVQDLPGLSDRTVADDVQRTGLLVEARKDGAIDLLWKYNRSANNELQKRASRRIEHLPHEGEAP